VSEYDREAPVMMIPWPTGGCCAMGKKENINLKMLSSGIEFLSVELAE
jgi:hypothetical protein